MGVGNPGWIRPLKRSPGVFSRRAFQASRHV
jgi:hypothetical protein